MRRYSLATMATILLLIFPSACSPSATANSGTQFSDVYRGDEGEQAIVYVSTEGYMVGKSDQVFDPDAPITRAEMSVLILRAKHGTNFSPEQAEGEWWVSWTYEAEAEGLIEKVNKPDAPATRADIATLIWLLDQ